MTNNLKSAIKHEAERFFDANKKKNASSAEERKAQKELDILMAQAGEGQFCGFDHSFKYKEKDVTVTIAYQQGVRDAIDVEKLMANTDTSTFLSIVTASKAAVEKEAGKNIANLCTISAVGEYKASVKEKK
jgi:hypothetical protein